MDEHLEEAFNMDDLEKDDDLQRELRMLGWQDEVPLQRSPVNQTGQVLKQQKTTPAYIAGESEIPKQPVGGSETPPPNYFDEVEKTDDSNIDFTDEDMQDPYLLAQLKGLNSGLVDDGENFNFDEFDNGSSVPDVKPQVKIASVPMDSDVKTDISTADEAKAKAVFYHKEGNKAEALRWLKISKAIDLQGIIPSGDGVTLKRQQISSSSLRTAGPNLVSENKVSLSADRKEITTASLQNDRFSHLESALKSAMRETLKEAQSLLATDKRTSANKLREYKRYQEELNVLASRRDLPGAEPAPFLWTNIEKQIVIERLDVGDDQLVLHIEGISDLQASLDGYSSRTIQIAYDLGVPREAPTTGKVTGKADANGNVILNYQSVLPIIKRGRSMQTLLSKKKATFEISLIRGMFYSPVVLGTASLLLADLNTKCECGGVLPIEKVVSSTTTGKKVIACSAGSVTVHLRLRKPIAGAEIMKVVERTLVLEAWPSVSHVYRTPAVTSSSAPPKPAKTPTPTPTSDDTRQPQIVPKQAVIQEPLISPQKSVSKQTVIPVDVVYPSDRERSDPCGVDWLESNDVLEAEITADQAALLAIEKVPAANRSEEEENAVFSLGIRIQLMNTKLQMLVASVQEEKLSFEDYIARVKDRLAKDRQLLKWVITASRLADPPEGSAGHMSALAKRINIMEKEIASAEEAMS